ncbi:uncharacterized protein TNCT_172641 [Trichonephila clavata]|uniref:Uncharacterized protein n=1 Tax=Trichonephila clavata TaxID=2740835 RepID=A0A8X6HU94_TRICU|nr:uncharacterized protein TNCT_172641 [Trichonephila clavata]
MKVILFVCSVVLLVTEVYGFLGRIGGVAYDGTGYYPFRVTQLPVYFPKCKEFMKALEEKMTEYGSRPYNCLGTKDRDECNFEQLMKARMTVTSKPSQECIDQVQQFLIGDLDASAVDGSPSSGEKST